MPLGSSVEVSAVEDSTHLCAAHGRADERDALHASFVAAGLGRNQRTLFVSDRVEQSQVLELVARRGVDVAESLRLGALVALDARDVYGARPGDTDPQAARTRYRELAGKARADGYVGLASAVELHSLVGFRDLDQLLEHERLIGEIVSEEGIVALCQYEPDGFAAPLLADLLAAHDGHACAEREPLVRVGATDDGLRLSGEIDLSVLEVLNRAIAARARTGPVELDCSELEFVDVMGARALLEPQLRHPHAVVRVRESCRSLDRITQLLDESGEGHAIR